MKKTGYKALFLWLMIFIFTAGNLAGCGSRKVNEHTDMKKETAKGRFLEEETALPKDLSQVEVAGRIADGSLYILGLSEDTPKRVFYSSTDNGKTWTAGKVPEKLSYEKCSYIQKGAFSFSGKLFISGAFGEEGTTFENWLFEENGKGIRLDIPLKNDRKPKTVTENFVIDALFTENDKLFVMDLYQDIFEIDQTNGQIISEAENTDDTSSYGSAGNYLFLFSENKNILFNTDTGDKQEIDDSLKEIFGNEENHSNAASEGSKSVVYSQGKDGIFLASQKGIFYYNPGGNVAEQLVNGDLCSLSDPSFRLKQLWFIDKEHFLLFGTGASGDVLLSFNYSEDVPAVPEKEVKVYSLEESSEVRQAISTYQKEHPDTYVNYIIGKSGKDAVTTADALRTLNTDIMAGKGPDVFILDGMPVENYIAKGLLSDISDTVNELKKEDSFFDNLCTVYEKDGKIYGIPSRFYLSFIQGSQECLHHGKSLSDFSAYVKQFSEKEKNKIILNLQANALLTQLFYADSANWIFDNHIDENGLRRFYQSAKEIYDANPDKENALCIEETHMASIGSVGSIDLMMKNISINMGTIGSDTDLMMLHASTEEEKNKTVDYTLFGSGEKKIFIPMLSIGLSGKSGNPDSAKEFIKTFLSKNVSSLTGNGLPTNRTAFNTQMERFAKQKKEEAGISMSVTGDAGEAFNLNMHGPTREEIAKLTGLIESLNTPAPTDQVVLEQVVTQGEKYLEDNQSLEDTVKNVMKKISLYLSE